MKIKEYNEMMAYLTRKKPDTKEVMNKKNDMETYVKNTTANNENPGSFKKLVKDCLLYTSPSPRDRTRSRMPSSA